jgi:hypothetical protein
LGQLDLSDQPPAATIRSFVVPVVVACKPTHEHLTMMKLSALFFGTFARTFVCEGKIRYETHGVQEGRRLSCFHQSNDE